MKKLFLFLSLAAAAFAQSPFPDAVIGTRPGAFSARSLGMGHTFLTNQSGSAALMGNPATLSQQESRWLVNVNADVSRVKETRSYPFYDSFDGILNYNNYAINDHLYSKLNGGVSFMPKVSGVRSFVLSAASYSAYQFDYIYHEEVRNRFSSGGIQDQKLGENRLDVTGDLRALSFGAATRLDNPFAFGFSVSMLSGDWTYLRGVYYAEPDSNNIISRVEYTPEGTPAEFTLGGTCELNQRISLGARALLPTGEFKFEQDGYFEAMGETSTSAGTVTVNYPSRIGAGVSYRPQNIFRPLVTLEGDIVTFSDVHETFDDVFEIRAGTEQQVAPGAPVRFGFIYSSSPYDDSRANTLFTAGIGFHLHKLTADFGLELGKMNYTEADMFPQSLYGDDNRTDTDRVETALFRGLINLSWSL